MNTHTKDRYDVIVVGSGMGGMSAAAMLASEGFKVLILEAAHLPGGCSSSFYRKGHWFETGATTLMGFDKHQPLRKLEQLTGIKIPRMPLNPAMQVHFGGEVLTRYQEYGRWLREVQRVFGQEREQQQFWALVMEVSDIVWKASERNPFFPPQSIKEWLKLVVNNRLSDLWVLPYALKSVSEVMKEFGLLKPGFRKFIDEQLMITAQSKADDTPFLFGAPALSYTNYGNYYVPGGFIRMVEALGSYVQSRGGALHTREAVKLILNTAKGYLVSTEKNSYHVPRVISNVPVWNMPELTTGSMRDYFNQEAMRYDEAWGAITLGMVTTDTFPEDLPLHHQLHLPEGESIPHTRSESIFVSLSHPDDEQRTQRGYRVLNISCHTETDNWFNAEEAHHYEGRKRKVEQKIIALLKERLPGFGKTEIINVFSGTPVTWQNWVYRKRGRVGGIPQNMSRSLLDWTPASPPFKGLYLCGDTVFPGQGIPGVTLSGINVYYRVKENCK